jgi:hypothetical protein
MPLTGVDQNNPPPEYTPLGLSQWIQDVAFSANDGSEAAPGISFDSENSTGFWRVSNGVVGVALTGSELLRFKSTGIDFDTGTFRGELIVTAQTVADVSFTIPDLAGVSDTVVFESATQTLTNKTFSVATLNDVTLTGTPDASAAIWSDLGQVLTADIDGGTLDSVVVGGASAAAGTFTALSATSVSGAIVGADTVHSFTNKTLDSFTNTNHADTVHVEIRNESGGTIAVGDAVYISGYSVGQDKPLVQLADATADATMPGIAIVTDASIANNATGDATQTGRVTGIDTSAWSAGDTLWVSETGTTGNTLQNTPPAGTAKIQKIATVLRSHATLGVIQVGPERTNALPNLANTKLWIGDASGVPQEFALSGDVTMTAGGVVTVVTNANLTGAITSVGNATSLGSFTLAQLNTAISDGTVVDTTDIGVSVQAYSATLDTWASKTPPAGTIVGTSDTQTLTNKTINTASNTLTVVEADISDLQSYLLPADIGSSVQAYDAGLLSIAALVTSADKMVYTTASDVYATTDLTSFARTLLDDATQGAMQTTLGVDPAGTDNSTDVSLTGSYDYITIAGQVITVGQVDLATDVTGAIGVTSGGTGQTTVAVGDILYGSGVNTWSKLAAGSDTNVLTLSGGVPTWAAAGSPAAHASTHEYGGVDEINTFGAISVDDTTDSTSEVTGSIHTDGGLGVAKDVIIGAPLSGMATKRLTVTDTADDNVVRIVANQATYTSTPLWVGVLDSDRANFNLLELYSGNNTTNPFNQLEFRVTGEGDTLIRGGYSFLDDDDTYMASGTANQLDWYVGGANDMRLESDGDLHVEGDVIAFSTTISSDLALKENIETVVDPIAMVNKLRGVTFDWKKEYKGSSIGVIAQEVEKHFPELVEKHALNGMKTVNYSALIGILIEAVKDLSEKVGE